jgi:DNA-binding beta-propeller fold protein YncE
LTNQKSFELETTDHSIQTLMVTNTQLKIEGLAFSPDGQILGATIPDTNTVLLFRRKPDGRFDDLPLCTLCGPDAGLNFPHDLSFCQVNGTELLAVAERTNAISIFEGNVTTRAFAAKPVFRIKGPQTGLDFSDAAAFVPPGHTQLAACNYSRHRISFFEKKPGSSAAFSLKPSYELRDSSLRGPDGLAFSASGTWLAVANHSNHTVSLYRRWRGLRTLGRWRYGPKPVTIIRDSHLRYPHSVAFTPSENHLVATNSGANFFNVYATVKDHSGKITWAQTPVFRHQVADEDTFKRAFDENPAEGGPKGLAIHGNHLAVCNATYGIKIFTFRETA